MSAAALKIIQDYLNEVYIECAFGLLFIIARLGVRLRTVGWRNLAWDDFGMVFLMACLIFNTVTVNIVVHSGGTNTHLSDAVRASLTPHQIEGIVKGTKWFFFGNFAYVTTLWTTKVCMAIFLGRMTIGLRRHRWVIVAHVLNAGSYVIICITLLLTCLPIRQRWQIVPAPPKKCLADGIYNELLAAPFNIIIDILLMAIPIPLLWQSSMPLSRKLGLCFLLCGGLFTIVAIILRTTLSITASDTSSTIPAIWACREYLIANFVTNAPLIKPGFSRQFWRRGPYRPRPYTHQQESSGNGTRTGQSGKVEFTHSNQDLELDRVTSHGRGPSTTMSDLKIQRHQEFEVSSQVDLTAGGRESEENLEHGHGIKLGPRGGWNTSEVHGPTSSRSSSEKL